MSIDRLYLNNYTFSPDPVLLHFERSSSVSEIEPYWVRRVETLVHSWAIVSAGNAGTISKFSRYQRRTVHVIIKLNSCLRSRERNSYRDVTSALSQSYTYVWPLSSFVFSLSSNSTVQFSRRFLLFHRNPFAVSLPPFQLRSRAPFRISFSASNSFDS